MVYDTLFAMDEKLQHPAADGRQVRRSRARQAHLTFTLRDGLEFHDGQPVTAEDCVASLKRWGARDALGQQLHGSSAR